MKILQRFALILLSVVGLFLVGCGGSVDDGGKTELPVEYSGTVVNVRSVGAVGDGKTDDSAAIQTAIDQLKSVGGGQLYLPAGNYLVNEQIVLDSVDFFLNVKGSGMDITRIYINNTDGFMSFNMSQRSSQMSFSDFSLYAQQKNIGSGIRFTMPEGGNRHNRSLVMENIGIYSDGINNSFKIGLDITGQWRSLLDNIVVHQEDGTEKGEIGINTNDTYTPFITNCSVENYKTGVTMIALNEPPTPSPEGFFIGSTTLTKCDTGIEILTKGIEPQIVFESCVFDCTNFGIKMYGKKFIQILNSKFSFSLGDDNAYKDIYLENCFDTVISNNVFSGEGENRIAVELTGPQTKETLIVANVFDLAGTGVYSNVDSNVVRDNIFTDRLKAQVIGTYSE